MGAYLLADISHIAGLATRIRDTARALAAELAARGWPIVTGGTDNHMVLTDVGARGLTGAIAEQALEACGIIVNRNKIHNDGRPARIAGGIRFGTNILALRGMDEAAIAECADIVDRVWSGLTPLGDKDFVLPEDLRSSARAAVGTLCWRFPLPA
ncbi:glycine/serine hydroxymethyltransferase [Crossiella equi]|uniref:Glycine/serine hydroxymethyltransferase n=1 Tax=Crossiella equi TaxID=130796 RepID=A0ABS5AN60_9PSEU|nr:glycine/serine hydroxymethyltransferase [Crossiella equi]